jgi:predicted Na+-dependent transporter
MTLKTFINQYFGIIICLGIIVALIFQNVALLFNDLIIPFVMVLNFICFLNVDRPSLGLEIKDRKYQILSSLKSLIILPVLIYYISYFIFKSLGLDTNFALGTFLMFASPTAATASVLCLFCKGKFDRSILQMVLTSFIIPLTLPILLLLTNSGGGEIKFWKLFWILLLVITIPFVLALIVRRISAIHKTVKNNAQLFSLIAVLAINIGALSGFVERVSQSLSRTQFSLYLLITTFLFILVFLISWKLERKKNNKDKMTTAVNYTWKNIGLAIGIAHIFFSEAVLIAVILYILPYNLLIPVLKKIAPLINDETS